MKYVAPERGLKSYTCPHCGVLARQYHFSVSDPHFGGSNNYTSGDTIASTVCENCNDFSLWVGAVMVYPNRGNAPIPNSDMPDDVKTSYEEAATIAALSPKAAAALLRLAIQKLCVRLGGKGKNINDDIAVLVKNGLPERVQQALDIVRVVGNNAVHPGQIDIDDPEVVGNLFALTNVIVESMISVPNNIGALYAGLPKGALDGINKRDGKAEP
jgi:hypothetical protein